MYFFASRGPELAPGQVVPSSEEAAKYSIPTNIFESGCNMLEQAETFPASTCLNRRQHVRLQC